MSKLIFNYPLRSEYNRNYHTEDEILEKKNREERIYEIVNSGNLTEEIVKEHAKFLRDNKWGHVLKGKAIGTTIGLDVLLYDNDHYVGNYLSHTEEEIKEMEDMFMKLDSSVNSDELVLKLRKYLEDHNWKYFLFDKETEDL